MLKFFFLLILINQFLQAQISDYNIKPTTLQSSQYMNIKILDSKEISFDDMDGIPVTELSALAYKNNILYSLSDRGYLYTFIIDLKNDKINTLKLKKASKLQRKNKKNLRKKDRDSEGLVFLGGELLISFEKEPRVELFSINGIKIEKKKIHKDLQNIKNYKSKNKALEAVVYNKKYGVMTAPEIPLKIEKKAFHRLYAKDKIYKFKASGNITALEFIDDDTLMVLERSFNKKNFRIVITLTKVYLKGCKKRVCKSELLAKFDSLDGWRIDNFEGLTKVGKNKYLMISDDNDSFLQKTLLVLFEI